MIGEVSRDARTRVLRASARQGRPPVRLGALEPEIPHAAAHRQPFLEDELEESFFENAIRRAAGLRRDVLKLDAETDSYRAIHGDADFLPGMVADKFADVLSVEITNLAAWQRLPDWLPMLHECFETQRVVVSVDMDLARIEGIPRFGGVESDNVRSVKIREHGIRYEVDFRPATKPGFSATNATTAAVRRARRRAQRARPLLLHRRLRAFPPPSPGPRSHRRRSR